MNQLEALLLAVGNAPEDDAPRLILADWLEENGEPRAALLRESGQLWAILKWVHIAQIGAGAKRNGILYWRTHRPIGKRRLFRIGEVPNWGPELCIGKITASMPNVYYPGFGWATAWLAEHEAAHGNVSAPHCSFLKAYSIGCAIKAIEAKYLRALWAARPRQPFNLATLED